MSERYREIRKNRIILEQRKPWEEETVRQLLEWETGNFVYSCMFLNGKNLSREAVRAIVSGDLVKQASFADYATAQGLEAAVAYLRRLADDIETPFERVLVSKTAYDKLPTEAELCLLWCNLEGKTETEARKVWDAKDHYRTISPVIRELSHVPCHFRDLPGKMTELYGWLKNVCGREYVNPIALAAEFHNRLLAVWPFASHNEDMAKLAAESVLLAYGLPLVPWSTTREAYHDAVARYLASVEQDRFDEDGFAEGNAVLTELLETLILRCQTVWLDATAPER